MASISIKLPVVLDGTDGFAMIKSIKDMIKQNLNAHPN